MLYFSEPDRVIVRLSEEDEQKKIKWQLDCVTGLCFCT